MTGIAYDHIGNTLNEGDLVMYEGSIFQVKGIEMTGGTMAIRPTISLLKVHIISDATMVVENGKKIKNLYKIQNPSVKDTTDLGQLPMDESQPS